MTDREMILEILKKTDITVFVNQPEYIEVENNSFGENISFDFSKSGKLLSIWS